MKNARLKEVASCGPYRRTCYSYNDEKGERGNVSTTAKKRNLLETKESEVEEWIRKQWK